MCLIGLRYDPPGRTLLVAANRDEFHHRPTRAAHWWPDHDGVLAGRDLESGGTWLGVTRAGRFAVVTNVREMIGTSGQRSRGELPLGFLDSQTSAEDYATEVIGRGGSYGGFNLLVYDGSALWWSSNRHRQPERVPAGVHAVSNDRLNTPWPKVQRMIGVLSGEGNDSQLLAALRDPSRPPGDLPDTGVGADTEAFLAPMFIEGDQYGTRCSTILSISRDEIHFTEASFGAEGRPTGQVSQRWQPVGR